MSALTVAERFAGPPGTANGGYLGGRLAALVGTGHRERAAAPADTAGPGAAGTP